MHFFGRKIDKCLDVTKKNLTFVGSIDIDVNFNSIR